MLNYNNIKYLVLDVDGTLTDSGIYYDCEGNELKKFSTKDGTGFNLCHVAGIQLIVITGRECEATNRRLKELKTEYICQNIKSKAEFLEKFMCENGISRDEIGYIGDDINDLNAMKLCAFVGCPEDSSQYIKDIADYVSPVKGGHGAMRDVVEHILEIRGDKDEVVRKLAGTAV